MSETLKPDHFTPHVDKVFRVRGGRHALTLTKVEQRPLEEHEITIGLRQPFNLLFRGPPGDVLPEGLYSFDIEGGPTFELHMIPVHTPMPGRQNYQAPFN